MQDSGPYRSETSAVICCPAQDLLHTSLFWHCVKLLNSATTAPSLCLLSCASRIDFYDAGREFLMHIMRRGQCSKSDTVRATPPLHKLIIQANRQEQSRAVFAYIYIVDLHCGLQRGINAVCILLCHIFMFPQLCGGGRPHCTFACQGSPVEGWESGQVRRGEAIVSVLNRKLHNICSLALREGVDSQLCVFRNVFWLKQNLHPDRRCDIVPPPPQKKKNLSVTVFNQWNFPFLSFD